MIFAVLIDLNRTAVISSQDQNTSLTRQGLSAASPHTASLCRRDHRVPGGGRSASSLRTSRRMTSEVRQPTRPLRRKGSLHFSIVVLTRNGATNFHSLRTGHRPPTHEHASARIIIRFPIPTPNTFLSKNRSMSATWTRRVLGLTTPIGVRRDDLLVAASGEERWAFTPGRPVL